LFFYRSEDGKIIFSKYSNILNLLKKAFNEPITVIRKAFQNIQNDNIEETKEKSNKPKLSADSMAQLQDVQFVIEGDFEFELISTVEELESFIKRLDDEKYFNNIVS
jgi:hypothetical protein